MVHQVRELAIVRLIAGDHGRLQRGDHVRVVHVVLPAVHVLQQSALRHGRTRIPGTRGQLLKISLEISEVRSLHAAFGAGEASLDDFVREPHDLEQL